MVRKAPLALGLALGILWGPLVADSQQREEPILRSTIRVDPGKYVYRAIPLKTYIRNGRIAGNALAQGGSGNDIRVLILTEEQFRAWERGQRTILPQGNVPGWVSAFLYDSGKRRSVVLSVPITEPGTYYVILDNSFSAFSAKNVSADVRFVHEGVDTARTEEVKKQVSGRPRRIGEILSKLVPALQEAEKRLGTHQIVTPIYFGIADDPTPNAGALWTKRLIVVNRGTLELVESMPAPQMGDDVLAGVLAHELAHIFYRHSFGDKPQQEGEAVIAGGAGALMIHPLVGLVAGALALEQHRKYDRLQEEEADILGVRLACAAGFDPSGLLTFMTKLSRLDPSQGSFLRDHPSPKERMVYLRSEIGKLTCRRVTEAKPPAQARLAAAACDSKDPPFREDLDFESYRIRSGRVSEDLQRADQEQFVATEQRRLPDGTQLTLWETGRGGSGAFFGVKVTWSAGGKEPVWQHFLSGAVKFRDEPSGPLLVVAERGQENCNACPQRWKITHYRWDGTQKKLLRTALYTSKCEY